MLNNNILIGSLTAAYTAAQVTAGVTPKLGTEFYDVPNCKKYKFLKNGESSSAIAAGNICVQEASDRSTNEVTLSGNFGNHNFAGIRISGATSLAAGECGWFQISGDFDNALVAPTGAVGSAGLPIITGTSAGAHAVAAGGYNSFSGFSGALSPFAISLSAQPNAGSAFSGRIIRSVFV